MNPLKQLDFGLLFPRQAFMVAVGACLVLAVGGIAWAQTGGTFKQVWYSIDGGSETISGGVYTLHGTIGQPEQGDLLSGGGYTLQGGITKLPSAAVIVPAAPAAAPVRNYFVVRNVPLSWTRVTYAIGYRVEVAKNTAFTPVLYFDDTLSADTLTWTTPALANGTYYWRVMAKASSTLLGPPSPYQQFVVNAP